MDTKLTLKLDKNIIQKAKNFAQKRHLSLSRIVENFFVSLIEEKPIHNNYSNLVNELSGIIYAGKKQDFKKEYTEYLIEKYK